MTPKCPDCKRDQDDCVCIDPQERIEELERERDGWKASAENRFEIQRQREERIATLQADNARLREALTDIVRYLDETATCNTDKAVSAQAGKALATTPEQFRESPL